MYFSHLLESDFALTTSKQTQMTKENSKGMKDLCASNVHKARFKEALTMHTHYSSIRRSRCRSLLEVTFQTITIPICSLIEHGFLAVFSIERKVMLCSNAN